MSLSQIQIDQLVATTREVAQEVVLPELQGDPFVEHEVNVANLTGAPR